MKSLTPERIFDYLLIVVVFLNFTNLYTFLAGMTGLSFKVVGILFILFMAGYCMVNSASLSRFLSVKPVILFLALFVIIPIVTLAYTPFRDLRYVGYTINFGMIFLVTGIWILKYGWMRFSKVILLSWACGITGIVLSYFIPSLFEAVALIQEQSAGGTSSWSVVEIAESSQSRAFGFYMQSNRASHAVMMHLMLLIPFFLHDRYYARIVVLGISFGAILLTGSRGGFLIICGFSFLLFFYELKNGLRTKAGLVSGFSALPRYMVLLAVGVLVALFILSVSIQTSNTQAGNSAVTRIFDSLFSSDYSLATDLSVQARLQAQDVFIERILERPIFGHGHFSTQFGKYTGHIPLAAHNMYYELAYEYGIPLATACYIYLFYLPFCREAKAVTHYFRYNPMLILVSVLCVYTFVSNTVFDLRMFPAVISFFLVMLYFQGGEDLSLSKRGY